MPQVKSEGIILKAIDWKENSRIVTFFTDNFGRQTIIDRGGRSMKSKRGRLLTFSRLEIEYFKSEKTGTGYLSEVEILEAFSLEKEGTLGRLTFASASLELLYDLLAEEDPQPELYYLTVQFLRLTDTAPRESLLPLFLAYFIKAMSFLGYRPNFAGCVGCGKGREESALTGAESTNGKFYFFTPERGGLVCPTCQIMGEYYIKLQSERLDRIYSLQTASLAEASAVRMNMKEGDEILELLTAFLRYQTEAKELNSLKFLEKLRKAQV
ncbi:putative DNA repair protein RecO [Candidatus Zixiibacteriota bacterium]|nr:putative DNA repair protein RecO [candidate division Zixibacteria bacterium]